MNIDNLSDIERDALETLIRLYDTSIRINDLWSRRDVAISLVVTKWAEELRKHEEKE